MGKPTAVDIRRRWSGPRWSVAGVVLAAILGGAGCRSGPVDYAREYPADKAGGPTLNIQVFRRENRISMTNTSAIDFGPSTLWMNAAYSRPIDGLDVGQTIDLSLHEFRDEFSNPFRAGGFFAIELPSALVLAEIETEDRIYGLIVVEDRAQ